MRFATERTHRLVLKSRLSRSPAELLVIKYCMSGPRYLSCLCKVANSIRLRFSGLRSCKSLFHVVVEGGLVVTAVCVGLTSLFILFVEMLAWT